MKTQDRTVTRRRTSTLSKLAVGLALAAGIAAPAAALADSPCESLTRPAMVEAIAAIHRARLRAEAITPALAAPDQYAAATRGAVSQLTAAENRMQALLDSIDSLGYFTPYVSNASVAYSIQSNVRGALSEIEYGRHWAPISAIYNFDLSPRAALEGKAAFTEAVAAESLVLDLGTHGGACYMHNYGL